MAYEQKPGSTTSQSEGGEFESSVSSGISSYPVVYPTTSNTTGGYQYNSGVTSTAAVGGAFEDAGTSDSFSYEQLAAQKAAEAKLSADAAAASAAGADTSEANALTSANSATASASTATSAATTATNAATSATNSATTATSASGVATTKAAEALASATSASTSASNASTSASNASTSATNASNSASSASSSANTATTQANLAFASATTAGTSATSAGISASNAATSASQAEGYKNSALSYSGSANLSAIDSQAYAVQSAASASGAATSASNADSYAQSANASAIAAEAAKDAALAAYDNFDDRYLGPKASDPTVDNDGNPLIIGALYFNTTSNVMKVYTPTGWVAAYVSAAGVLLIANNLSDVADVATSRTNLGLGSIATQGANAVAITGGSITGITDLAVADGGTGASTLTGYVKGSGTTPLTASSTIPSGDITGLGTMSTQDANSVAITGGTINGTTIGATTPAAGTFTTLTATGSGAFGTTVSGISRLVVKGGASAQCFRVEGVSGGFVNLDMVGNRTSGNLGGLRAFYETDSNEFFGIYPQATKVNTFFNLGNGSSAVTTQFVLSHTASAVNYVQVTGAATGGHPTISSQGSDSNARLILNAKGTSSGIDLLMNNARQMFIGTNGSAVNYLQTGGTTSGIGLALQAQGSDTNISQVFQSKGTGAIDLAAGSSGVNISNGGTVTAITRTAQGSGYTSTPSVAITAPTTAGGVQATATALMIAFGNSPTITSGGTGYTVSDVLTVTGGTFASAVTITVTSVSGGVITGANYTGFGNYTVLPSNPVSVTGGTGSGATFTISWGVNAYTITNAGSGYVEQPTVSFSGGGGSGAAAFAIVGSQSIIKGIGTSSGTISNQSVMFQTPSGNSLLLRDPNQATPDAHLMMQATASGYGILVAEGSNANASLFVGAKGSGSVRFSTSGTTLTEQMRIAHTASAVNYVQVTGNATGSRPTISSQGSDTNINLAYSSKGTGGHDFYTSGGSFSRQFTVLHTAGTIVNYATVTGSATGSGVVFSAAGTDTNIDLNLNSKGTGAVNLNTGGGTQFSVANTASATNYFATTGSNGGTPALYSVGASTNIGANFVSKGTGSLAFYTNGSVAQLNITHTASAVNYLQATGSATGSGVTLSAQGSDTNIDINLVPKGTGSTVYTGGVTVNGTLTAQTATLRNTQNLITYSEDLTNAVWGGAGTTASIISTVFASNTSQLVQTGSGYWSTNASTITGTVLGKTYVMSAWLWTTTDVGKVVGLRAAATSGGSGTVLSVTLTSTPTRYSIAATYTSSDAFPQFVFDNRSFAGADGLAKTYLVWGAQVEEAPTVGTYVKTIASAIYNVPSLSFNSVSTIALDASGNLSLQPAGTGALQAQATTSSAVGGNARGANAVDWQTTRDVAARVASGGGSVVSGGYANTASIGYSVVSGGFNNTAGYLSSVVGGQSNVSSGTGHSGIVAGFSNTASGYYNFIGGGANNSGTSSSVVTTQSGTMNGTTAVTLSGSNANIKVGQFISGTSIADRTYVAAISGTSLTLSQNASGSSTNTLNFYTPHGVVVGGGNNQATGAYSVILGGGDAGTAANRNVASGDWSVVAGGRRNTASGISSFVGGGGVYIGAPQTNFGHTASGPHSAIVGGLSNVASGESSFVGGGYGNSASNTYSTVVGGTINNANGTGSSILGGYYGTARSINGYMVFPACVAPIVGSSGVSQSGLLILAKETTTATPTVLTSDINASASTTNQIILPNNSAYYFKGSVIANVTGAANGASWSFEGAIMRGANAASTVLIGVPAVNRIAASSGATAWTIALTADTTNGGLAVTVTGAASTTIRWVCKVETTEVTF